MSIESKLEQWSKQAPGLALSPAELTFITTMRKAAAGGVGFGWMQQVIEWEWQEQTPAAAWGPESFEKDRLEYERRIELLETKLKQAKKSNR